MAETQIEKLFPDGHPARDALQRMHRRKVREKWFLFLAEWLGCFFGLVGCYLLAAKIEISIFGWVGYLISNIAMIVFAVGKKAWGLLTQQIGFCGATVLAFKNYGIAAQLWLLIHHS